MRSGTRPESLVIPATAAPFLPYLPAMLSPPLLCTHTSVLLKMTPLAFSQSSPSLCLSASLLRTHVHQHLCKEQAPVRGRDARRKESQENNLYQLNRHGSQSLIHCVYEVPHYSNKMQNLHFCKMQFWFILVSSFYHLTQELLYLF